MDVKRILDQATDINASDIFVIAGRPLSYKIKGQIEELDEIKTNIDALSITVADHSEILQKIS